MTIKECENLLKYYKQHLIDIHHELQDYQYKLQMSENACNFFIKVTTEYGRFDLDNKIIDINNILHNMIDKLECDYRATEGNISQLELLLHKIGEKKSND